MLNPDQHKLPSGIDPHTPAQTVLGDADLSGKTAIVTGGYSGIGLETTRALASAGARVIVPARTIDKAKTALAGLDGDIEIATMDLADLPSVQRFSNDVVQSGGAIDLLINNAGIMACPLSRTAAGWESQFGTNHLGHMVMTQGLLPALRKANGARVVCLSSTGHIVSDVHWDDPNFLSHDYDKWQAYGQSKTSNSLFAVGLDQREKDNGIRAFAVHPGGIMTDLQRHLGNEEMTVLGWTNPDGTLSERAAKSFKKPEAGASTTIFAATSKLLDGKGGLYCEDSDVANLATPESPRYCDVRPYAIDTEAADRLWALSEAMIAEA